MLITGVPCTSWGSHSTSESPYQLIITDRTGRWASLVLGVPWSFPAFHKEMTTQPISFYGQKIDDEKKLSKKCYVLEQFLGLNKDHCNSRVHIELMILFFKICIQRGRRGSSAAKRTNICLPESTEWLTAACNSSSRGSGVVFYLLQTPVHVLHTDSDIHTQTNLRIISSHTHILSTKEAEKGRLQECGQSE